MLTTKGVLVNSAKWQLWLALQLYPQGSRKKNEINDEWKKKQMDVAVAKKVAKSAGNFESPIENT